MNERLSPDDMERYQRQLALPEITPQHQSRLKNAHVFLAGAGGLGAAILPYLAGVGVGRITIADHDQVSLANLHRQIIFRNDDIGGKKSVLAAAYAARLNPAIKTVSRTQKITAENAAELTSDCDLIIDGTDNFETKDALNTASVQSGIPLVSASVEQWAAQIGIFAGSQQGAPCYRCLFPEFPLRARNCNEAGILGTAAGLAGLYEAHLALLYLLDMEDIAPGTVLSLDLKSLRVTRLRLRKDPACPHCTARQKDQPQQKIAEQPIMLVHPGSLRGPDVIVIDVRTDAEVRMQPITGALHIELSTLPSRFRELPQGKRLAFACAANVRSAQAAAFMQAMGYPDVCIYDVLAD